MTIPAKSVQSALDAASSGATVDLPAGRIDGGLIIRAGVYLKGRGPDQTVLDGRLEGPTLAVDAKDGLVRIEGVRITGGRSSGGGGVSIDNGAQVELIDCIVEKNEASGRGRGGGLQIDFGSVRAEDVVFLDNQAELGGGIFVGGDAELTGARVVFDRNRATRGGAVAVVEGARLLLSNSVLRARNRAERAGHLIFAGGRPGAVPLVRLEEVHLEGPRPGEDALKAELPEASPIQAVFREEDYPPRFELRATPWPVDSGPPPKDKGRRRTIHLE